MSKILPKKVLSSSYLVPLLKDKNYTLNDLKAEVIVMLFENFLKHYFTGEESKKSELIFDTPESKEDSLYVLNRLYDLRDRLSNENILTIDNLQKEVSKSLFIASKLSPYTILYNSAISTFTKERKRLFKGEELRMWIPDSIAVYLIIDAKDMGISFEKFPILENETFDDIIEIYTKTNLELRKLQFADKETKNTLREKSIIGKTANISSSMIEKIIEIN